MRLLAFVLTALLWALPVLLGGGGASAIVHINTPSSEPLVRDAKFVCGMTDEGFKCRNEAGAIRRGKNVKIPGAPSGGSSAGTTESSDPDALPPASDGTAQSAPGAAKATCPSNTEMLGGHCIPYTQTCNRGLAANANPQPCRGAEEKQVCSFRSDGLKDCCCRTYTKF